jgi:hypothetical protein
MPGIDDVLERLVNDADFRRWLRADPAAALRGYELSASEVELLTSQVDDSGGGPRSVEQRITKSALFELISDVLAPGAGAAGSAEASQAQPSQPADGWVDPPSGDGVDPKPTSSIVLKGSKINQNLLSGLSDLEVEPEPPAFPPDGTSNTMALGEATGSGGEPPEVASAVAPAQSRGDHQLEDVTGEYETSAAPPGGLAAQVRADQNESGALEADVAPPAHVGGAAVLVGAEDAEPAELAAEHQAKGPDQGVSGEPEPFWRLADANDAAGENGPSGPATPSGGDGSQHQAGRSRTPDVTGDG